MDNKEKVIVALDLNNLNKAKKLVKMLWPRVRFFKIGLEFINTGKGPELTHYINRLGGKVFYDIKLNDIPNTVARAVRVIAELGVWGFTIHASSGRSAIREAVKNKGKSKVFGITVLTSLCDEGSNDIFGDSVKKKVIQFADTLLSEGADGIVCSPLETKLLRKFSARGGLPARGGHSAFGRKKLKLITPGIRPKWANKNEQERVATPSEAIKSGADYLVIGRPITDPPEKVGSSVRALELIIKELQ